MKHFFVKIFSNFIKDKNRRKEFLEKYDPIKKLERRIINRIQFSISEELQKRLNPLNFVLTYNYGLEHQMVSSYQEHLQNIENLKRNLDETDKKYIDLLQDQMEIVETMPFFMPKLIYTEAQFQDYLKAKRLHYNIIRNEKENYFQYKNYKLCNDNFWSYCFLYHHGLDKLKTRKNITDNQVIIDAGAALGDSALIFREYFPKNKIISFEPIQSQQALFENTMKLNNMDNIILERKALGNENTKKYMTSEGGCSTIILEKDRKKYAKVETISSVRLDDYVKENNLKVGLIKTDLEGFEPQFLEGAKNTICNQKPILIISIYHNYADFYKIKPLIESWNLGYKFSIFKGIDELDCYNADIMLLAECEKK